MSAGAPPPGTSLRRPPVPPALMVMAGIVSVQTGAAIATTLFDRLGPAGTVWLRILFGAVVLVAVWRPGLALLREGGWQPLALFGVALGGMNLSFYEALDRLPLGVVVTLEMVGPLSVAIAGSRRRLDLAWVTLAAAGVLLLWGGDTSGSDALGVLLAVTAGACWGAYILISAHVGKAFSGGNGLALAMVLAAALTAPAGIAQGGSNLLDPGLLAVGLAVGIMSSVIPYSLELEALRHMPTGTFGVLMSLEPAMAALAGLVVVGQRLSLREVAAILLVVAASIGATRADQVAPPPEV